MGKGESQKYQVSLEIFDRMKVEIILVSWLERNGQA